MAERNRTRRGPGRPRKEESRSDKNETLERQKNRWKQGRDLRQRWRSEYNVEQLYQRFLGKTSVLALDDDELRINRFLPTIQTQLPSLFFQNPSFRVVLKEREATGDTLLRSGYAEAILHEISTREFNLEKAVTLALLQNFFSIGVLKIVYDPKTMPNPRRGNPIFMKDQNGDPLLDQVTGLPQPVTDPRTGQPTVEPSEHVTDEVYRFEWVNGDNMLLPDQGPDMGKWTWIGEEITVRLDEAKEDERFPKRIRDEFKPNGKPADDMFSGNKDISSRTIFETSDRGDEDFTYVEIWDIRKRRFYIMADGQEFSSNEFLVDEDYPEGVEEHPYAILPGFIPVIGPDASPWPLPYVYNWLQQEDEYSIRRRQIIQAGRRSARKPFYDDQTFADEDQALKALRSPNDMEAVKVTDVNRPWGVATDPELPAMLFQDLAFMDRDWIRTTGLPGSRVGGARAGSATEANIELQSGNLRDSDLRGKVNRWLSDAGQKMLQRVQQTLTMGMWIRLRGLSDTELNEFINRVYPPQVARQLLTSPAFKQQFIQQFGSERPFQVTREELEFQARVLVIPGSSRIRTIESDRQQFLEALQILGAAPQIMQSRILLRLMLQMFEIEDDALIDEIIAVAQQSIEIERDKAGRNQGGNNTAATNGSAQGVQGGGLGALLGG